MHATPPSLHSISCTHVRLEGTAWEAGRRQGETLAATPEAAAFFTGPHPERGPLAPAEVDSAIRFFDRHCPGLNEEIAGCAEALGVPPERILYYAVSFDHPPVRSGQCSVVAVMPSHAADGHLRIARSYEFSHEMSDLRLATTRIQSQAAHIGFSEVLFGRDDGFNEHGLCVAMAAGAPMMPAEPGGCLFWALVRTVLDRCALVDEALDAIQDIPLSFNLNLLLADRSGQAALVEMASSHRAVRRFSEGWQAATNHFSLPEMRPFDLGRRWNSVERQRVIRRHLEATRRAVTARTLRTILSSPFPEGVCAHDDSGYFGTLWSEIFDVTAGTVEVCFGPPTHNPWHTFSLAGDAGPAEYSVRYPDISFEASFWRKLEPGAEA